MQKAALYMRVSTEDQLEFSIDAQKRALIEYGKRNDMIIDEKHIYIDEGISGTSAKKRPAFQLMIATAKKKPKPFDVILVHKYDRFARSREDSVVYKSLLKRECDIQVISITEQIQDDKFGVILESMLEGMAEYYSLNLSDEVMKGMSEKARRGGTLGMKPYGYDVVNGKVFVNKEEAEIVKSIYKMFLEDGLSYRLIADKLNAIGATNKRGNRFEGRNVKYILQNPIYCGLVRWNYATQKGTGRKINDESEWIIAKGQHEAIITENTYRLTVEAIKEMDFKYASKKPVSSQYKHFLGGLLRCSACGGTLTTTQYKHYLRYQCNKYRKGSCDTCNSIPAPVIEQELINHFKNELTAMQSDKYTVKATKRKDDNLKSVLEANLERVRKKYEAAKRAYLAEIDTLEEYKSTKEAIQKEENEILKMLENEVCEKVSTEAIQSKITTGLQLLSDENATIEEKNKFLKSFIEKIVIDRKADKMGIYYHL